MTRTVTLQNRVHDMVVKKQPRAEIEKMLRGEFHFADLHVQASLDGLSTSSGSAGLRAAHQQIDG